MVKLPELNRHVVGVSAIAAALLGLGYLANIAGENRPVASLSGGGAQMASSLPGASAARDFLSMLKQTPPDAYGSAAGLGPADATGGMTAPGGNEASVASGGSARSGGGATAARNWTADEWRIASEAVSMARSHVKGKPENEQRRASAASGILWQPPEEIAGRSGSR